MSRETEYLHKLDENIIFLQTHGLANIIDSCIYHHLVNVFITGDDSDEARDRITALVWNRKLPVVFGLNAEEE